MYRRWLTGFTSGGNLRSCSRWSSLDQSVSISIRHLHLQIAQVTRSSSCERCNCGMQPCVSRARTCTSWDVLLSCLTELAKLGNIIFGHRDRGSSTSSFPRQVQIAAFSELGCGNFWYDLGQTSQRPWGCVVDLQLLYQPTSADSPCFWCLQTSPRLSRQICSYCSVVHDHWLITVTGHRSMVVVRAYFSDQSQQGGHVWRGMISSL